MRGAERPGKGGRGTGGDRFLTKGLSGTSPMSPMFAKFIAQIRVCVCVCECVCVCVLACIACMYIQYSVSRMSKPGRADCDVDNLDFGSFPHALFNRPSPHQHTQHKPLLPAILHPCTSSSLSGTLANHCWR